MPTDFLNETPFQLAPLVGRVGFPGHSLTLVVKGTFVLRNGGKAVLAKEQDEFCGDVAFDDDESGEGAPQYEADLVAPTKPRTDFVVVGHCHTPGQQPLRQCEVAAGLGAHVHHLQIYGERQWLADGRASTPQPFVRMPLRYERSYGGALFPENPTGLGFRAAEGPSIAAGGLLPYIEDPRTPIGRAGVHVFPAGFGPLHRQWRFRAAKLGTYNDQYLKTRWPALPEDFDPSHYNAAHPSLQLPGYAQGDEQLSFINMHPQHASYGCTLPGIKTRAFLDIPGPNGDAIALREVAMHLDTAWVNVDDEKLVLVWRGITQVSSPKYPEVRRIYVVAEDASSPPRSTADFEVLLSRHLIELSLTQEPPDARVANLAAAMGAGGFGSTAAWPTAAPMPATAAGAQEDEADDASFAGQLSELEASLAAMAGAMPEDLDQADAEEPAMEIEDLPLTPEERASAAKDAIASGTSLAGQDLSGLDLSGVDFAAADLAGALLIATNLSGAKLDGCNLTGATLTNANLVAASAVKANFSQAQLPGCNLDGANVSEAKFQDANLSAATCVGTNFESAILSEAVFSEANLSQAKLARANLNKANLSAANAAQADFSFADLSDATIEGCVAPEATFTDVTAPRLRAAEAQLAGSLWQRSRAAEAVFTAANLERANLSAAQMPGSSFAEATLAGAIALAADLKQARFGEANLTGANLSQSNLFEAIFEAAILDQANLRACNAYGAEFLEATIKGCDFRGANLKRTKLEGRLQS